MIRDVAELRERAERAGEKLATLTLRSRIRFATPEDRNAFAEDLVNDLAKLVSEYHDESDRRGETYEMFIGGYPEVEGERGD